MRQFYRIFPNANALRSELSVVGADPNVGRLDLQDYRAHREIKEKWYEKNFPGKLLITYEGKDLSTAAMDIIKGHK
jgi:hypothetical protein